MKADLEGGHHTHYRGGSDLAGDGLLYYSHLALVLVVADVLIGGDGAVVVVEDTAHRRVVLLLGDAVARTEADARLGHRGYGRLGLLPRLNSQVLKVDGGTRSLNGYSISH